MKKIIIIMMGLFSLMMPTSCSNDDVNDWTPHGWIRDVTGIISYNKDLQVWHFLSFWPYIVGGNPSIDLYPIELRDDFKVDGLLVTISGNIYTDEGEQRDYIEIINIKEENNLPIIDKDGYYPMDLEDCFVGCVTDAKDDRDSMVVLVTETPDSKSIPYFAPNENTSVYCLKSDLHNSDIQEGDYIDFRIVRYKMLHIMFNGPETYCDKYFCSIKPCK